MDGNWQYYHSIISSHLETKICGVLNSWYTKRRTLEKSLGNFKLFYLDNGLQVKAWH